MKKCENMRNKKEKFMCEMSDNDIHERSFDLVTAAINLIIYFYSIQVVGKAESFM
jgi:hypothetical protein